MAFFYLYSLRVFHIDEDKGQIELYDERMTESEVSSHIRINLKIVFF